MFKNQATHASTSINGVGAISILGGDLYGREKATTCKTCKHC